jgi:hypothetical protein
VVANDPVARSTTAALRRRGYVTGAIRRAYEAGARTFSWSSEDPDQDRLSYRLEIRREDSTDWIPLALDIEEAFFSWDARSMPDGLYRVRLTATDAPDNPSGRELQARRVSDAFYIDNTRPSVRGFEVERHGEGVRIEFVAADPGGSVAAVEVAFDGGTWAPLNPLDGVADSAEERYRLSIDPQDSASAPPARSVMVRVTDAVGNLGGDMRTISREEIALGQANPRLAQ